MQTRERTPLFNHRELASLNLTAKAYRNGAVHIFGTLEDLSSLVDLCITRGVHPRFYGRATSYPVGKPEEAAPVEGYPRIEVHPCHRERIDLGMQVTEAGE